MRRSFAFTFYKYLVIKKEYKYFFIIIKCTNNYLPSFLRCPIVSFRTVIPGAFLTGRRMRRFTFITLIMFVILLGAKQTNFQIIVTLKKSNLTVITCVWMIWKETLSCVSLHSVIDPFFIYRSTKLNIIAQKGNALYDIRNTLFLT